MKFAAPELWKNESSTAAVDIWSLGVLLVCMLQGPVEFAGAFDWKKHVPNNGPFSDGAGMLLDALLQTDPQKRPSLEEIVQHPWLKEGA